MTPLKKKRLALGLTTAEIAKKIGCSGAGYNAWENGMRVPDARWYPKIAKALGIKAAEVVELIIATPEPSASR